MIVKTMVLFSRILNKSWKKKSKYRVIRNPKNHLKVGIRISKEKKDQKILNMKKKKVNKSHFTLVF